MEVTYIKVFIDLLDAMEPFGDAERGRLFTAMLEYARTGEVPQLGGNERYLFPMIKAQLDRDREALQSRARLNSENGKLGGRPKKAKESEKSERFFEKANKSEKSQDKDKDKDKDKDNIPPKPPTGDFERFWAVYPKKVGKEAARKAFSKVKTPVDALITAISAQKRSTQWKKDNGQYIPNPATWLNQGRWEDVLETPVEPDNSGWTMGAEELAAINAMKRRRIDATR
jgi:hypothetical protein